MARTQAANYEEIRRKILGQAAAVFAEKGYARATILDLAEACGMSRGALYHYFTSKEAILDEMLVAHLDLMYEETLAAANASSEPEARLRHVIRSMVMVNAASQNEQIVLLNDLSNLEETQRRVIVKKQNDVVAVFSNMIHALDGGRKIDARNLKAYTFMFLGMINYTYLWYDPTGPVTPDDYARMTADAVIAGIRGTGPRV